MSEPLSFGCKFRIWQFFVEANATQSVVFFLNLEPWTENTSPGDACQALVYQKAKDT